MQYNKLQSSSEIQMWTHDDAQYDVDKDETDATMMMLYR